jgi:fructose 1,6-bisphosphate aldolase/phosphatase
MDGWNDVFIWVLPNIPLFQHSVIHQEETMKTTLSIIKADIGSIGGHIRPSQRLIDEVRNHVSSKGKGILTDFFISHTGDDIAILFSHSLGKGSEKIHQLAWDAFVAGTKVAKEQGLYGAGQDLLKDSFSGNVKGMGPAVAEMEFEERPNEPFLFFAADKTDPGAYNLPAYLAFVDPMYNSGLILSPSMNKGFRFVIMDVSYTEGDRLIELNAPEETYDIVALLRDNQRFVIEAIYSRNTGEIAASVSTTRLHNIAGKYTGKDDPVMLVRVQGAFPATGEVLAPFNIGHYVAGFMRGSHTGPLMPVRMNSSISYFDGPPVVCCLAFCVHNGKLTEPTDAFDHPYWDWVRNKVAQKATDIRQQGFSGAAMLPYSELEYGGIVDKMNLLDKKFKVKK